MKKQFIADLMTDSGVGFGTSGARGLVKDMTDRVCYSYCQAFIQYLRSKTLAGNHHQIAVAGDLRPSTQRIMIAVIQAAKNLQVEVIYCGLIPSPAVALFGIHQKIPSIMVTGSHIPDDRNGIKFNTALGEITKEDEIGIREQTIELETHLFLSDGSFKQTYSLPEADPLATQQYLLRYQSLFESTALQGKRIGVYQHSGVARDLLTKIITELGATAIELGRSNHFIPVDTEAIRAEDIQLAQQWAPEHQLDAIISTDGDADRPLISDEKGNWLRGDVVGPLCARFLGVKHIVTPVSSNTAVELSGWFKTTQRTRIGSPFVIEGMQQLALSKQAIAGYEANGGFLSQDTLQIQNKSLSPLPTRDAMIVLLSLLIDSTQQGITLSALAAQLPQRYTHSDRIKQIPTDKSNALINRLSSDDAINHFFDLKYGKVKNINQTDGLRITFESGNIVHFRPSGNAPELRCYTEANRIDEAASMNQHSMALIKQEISET